MNFNVRILFLSKFILVQLLTANYCSANNLSDTTYFDRSWNKVSNKNLSAYFRVTDKFQKNFKVSDYYANGIVQMQGVYSSLKPEVKEGNFIWFDSEGNKTSEKQFHKNKMNGTYKEFYGNGSVKCDAFYKNDELDGEFKSYYANGRLKRFDTYKDEKLLTGKCFSADGNEIAYLPYFVQPNFTGGNNFLAGYLQENIVYPEAARRNNVQGKVLIKFTVDVNGKIGDVTLNKSVNPLLDEQALYVVRNMPTWNPGLIDGDPVKMYLIIPILFNLTSE